MKPLVIPANAAAIVGAVSCSGWGRFGAATGVQVTSKDEGRAYQLVTTDGKILAVINGPCSLSLKAEEGDNGITPAEQAIIPATDFAEIFGATIRRLDRTRVDAARIDLGASRSLLSTQSGDTLITRNVANVEGRFPNYDAVLAPIKASPPVASIDLDVRGLIPLLKIAAALHNDEPGRTTLSIVNRTEGSHYLTLTTKSDEGQEFYAVLVSLEPQKSVKPQAAKAEQTV